METVQAKFTDDTTLLIQGVQGKVDNGGKIKDVKTLGRLKKFILSFKILVEKYWYEKVR